MAWHLQLSYMAVFVLVLPLLHCCQLFFKADSLHIGTVDGTVDGIIVAEQDTISAKYAVKAESFSEVCSTALCYSV